MQQLKRAGFRATSLQGDLTQGRRQAAIEASVPARLKFWWRPTLPPAASMFCVFRTSLTTTCRIPWTPTRTASAAPDVLAKTGDALTFITSEDEDMVRRIENVLRAKVKRCLSTDFDYKKAAVARESPVRPATAPTPAPLGTEKKRKI